MTVYNHLIYFAPIFLAMIMAEYFLGKRSNLILYTKNESFISLVIAVGQNATALFSFGLVNIVWLEFYNHRIFSIPADSWLYYPISLLIADFSYYWFHRINHKVRWLWASHSVHHSTKEMNILSAYRFGWTDKFTMTALVYSPMFLFGVYPPHFIFLFSLILIYQSWLHTDLIGKLGWLEGIFNTPSAHRVHHGKNAEYLDRNFGGILIIWDRIFGTYVKEDEAVQIEYGLINSSSSKNPIRIVFHEWVRIAYDLKNHPIRYWPMLLFGPPNWTPDRRIVAQYEPG